MYDNGDGMVCNVRITAIFVPLVILSIITFIGRPIDTPIIIIIQLEFPSLE